MTARRDFLKHLALGSGLLVSTSLLGRVSLADDKKLTKKDMIPESNEMAKGLNYCENADKDAKAKAPKCPGHRDAAKKGQSCGSPCNFYTSKGKVDGVDVGSCLLMQDPPNKYVSSKGWCNSWAPKA